MVPLRTIERVIFHHSASPREVTTCEQIRGWHLEKGWDDIGYHFVIEAHGVVQRGRPLPSQGAHALGANHDSVGICLVGDNTREGQGWNGAQRTAALGLLAALEQVLPPFKIMGHREASADGHTACPGLDVKAWLYLGRPA